MWLSVGKTSSASAADLVQRHRRGRAAAERHDQHAGDQEALPHAPPQRGRALVIHGLSHRAAHRRDGTAHRGAPRERRFGATAASGRDAGAHRAGSRSGTLGRCSAPAIVSCSGWCPSALLVIGGLHGDLHPGREQLARAPRRTSTLNHASSASLTYGALFLGLCLAAHLVIRFALPHADPYLFPLVAVLASVGIVMVYRIEPGARPPAGPVDGARAGAVRRDDPRAAPARGGRARALPLHDRRGRHRHDGAAAPARHRRAGQRRLPRHPRRQRLLPAGRAREGRDRDLPRQLPARQPPDPRDRRAARARRDDPADEAVRPDADRVGRGDGHAAAHARARHLADVLRRVPGAAVRGHRAPLVPADRPACCSRVGRLVRRRPRQPRPRARAGLGTPASTRRSTNARGRQLPDRPVAVRAGRRRPAGHRL